MASSREVFQLRGSTIDEVKREMNDYLQRLVRQLDDIQGLITATKQFSDFNMGGKRITSLGDPSAENDAQKKGLALSRSSTAGNWDAGGKKITNGAEGTSLTDFVIERRLQETVERVASQNLPIGVILLWSGSTASIPAGFQICDGTNGTPDLRDRFLVGAGSAYAVGATGGGTTHTHTGHANHVVTQPADHGTHTSAGGHTHDAHTTAADTTVTGAGTRLTGPVTHSSDGAHTHDAHPAHTGTAVDAHSAHDSPDHRPLFYALAYIQKVA